MTGKVMDAPKFSSSDSWLLVALLQATRDKEFTSLPELIAAADGVNQAVITRGELETGFARLVPAGYALCSAAGYAPSPSIKEWWAKNSGKNKSLVKSWESLSKFIGAPDSPSKPLPETNDESFVTKCAYEAAIAGYR
jgi:hypothetical protein